MVATKKPAPKPKKYCRTVTKTVKGKKKKYPGGRKLVSAGDQVLEDIPNP